MKNLIRANAKSCIAFSTTLFVVVFMLTFDSYSLAQITPETPLIKIGSLPFLRMDFILIIFSVAFLVGTLIAWLLKKASRTLVAMSTAILGIISGVVAILNVDLMQKLFPTMRISHVIMTLSLVLSIAVSVAGLFVGINTRTILKCHVPAKILINAVLIGTLLSVLAQSENLHKSLYIFTSLTLFFTSFVADFFGDFENVETSKFRLSNSVSFVSFLSLAVIFGTLFTVLCNSTGFSTTGYMIVSGLLFAGATLIIKTSFSALWAGLGLVGGSFASYAIVHYVGETITYSGNRVVYTLPVWIFIAYAILIAGSAILNFRSRQNHKK